MRIRCSLAALAGVLVVLALPSGARAEKGLAKAVRWGPFVERRGFLEFSGQMIVRPLQPNAAAAKTGSAEGARRLRTHAQSIIAPTTIEYYPETDEYTVVVPPGKNESTYSAYLKSTGEF